jgi:hypothetical protein
MTSALKYWDFYQGKGKEGDGTHPRKCTLYAENLRIERTVDQPNEQVA